MRIGLSLAAWSIFCGATQCFSRQCQVRQACSSPIGVVPRALTEMANDLCERCIKLNVQCAPSSRMPMCLHPLRSHFVGPACLPDADRLQLRKPHSSYSACILPAQLFLVLFVRTAQKNDSFHGTATDCQALAFSLIRFDDDQSGQIDYTELLGDNYRQLFDACHSLWQHSTTQPSRCKVYAACLPARYSRGAAHRVD